MFKTIRRYMHLDTIDNRGFSPLGDHASTACETTFARIRARLSGTEFAAEIHGKR